MTNLPDWRKFLKAVVAEWLISREDVQVYYAGQLANIEVFDGNDDIVQDLIREGLIVGSESAHGQWYVAPTAEGIFEALSS